MSPIDNFSGSNQIRLIIAEEIQKIQTEMITTMVNNPCYEKTGEEIYKDFIESEIGFTL